MDKITRTVFGSLFLSLICSITLKAQHAAILDSLRYFPLHENTEQMYNNHTLWISYLQGSYQIGTHKYRPIGSVSGGFECAVGHQEIFYRADTTTGTIYQSFGQAPSSFSNNFDFYRLSQLFSDIWNLDASYKDSLEFPIEQLYFAKSPEIGDTVLIGSSHFALSDSYYYDKFRNLDSIKKEDIVVIYKGYSEETDRALFFKIRPTPS